MNGPSTTNVYVSGLAENVTPLFFGAAVAGGEI